MADNEFIISKTDTKGKITYGNRPFNDYSGFSENEFLGIQHNIVRHSDMPRAVFKLLWMKCKLTESVAREMPNKR